jgi:hypothetical protein
MRHPGWEQPSSRQWLHRDFDTAVSEMTRTRGEFEPRSAAHKLYDELFRHVYRHIYPKLKPLYKHIHDIADYPAHILPPKSSA